MALESLRFLLGLTLIGPAMLGPSGCTPRDSWCRNTEPRLESNLEPAPGIEVEVLAAMRAGRGDAHLLFLLGRNGHVERTGTLGLGSIALVAAPERPASTDASPPVPLTEAEAYALRAAIETAICAASTPEVFDPPPEFVRSNGRPWCRVYPPVRLRVDPTWLSSESEFFDGTWLMLVSPTLPATDRVVVNVVGWRYSERHSRPLEIALSRGYLSEVWVVLQFRKGATVRELINAVRAQRSDELLTEGERTPWRAISGNLRVEVDRAWLEGHAPLDFESWLIVERDR